jgi:hypothetical protein
MASNKMNKKSLVDYIQEQVTNLYRLKTLKEQRESLRKEITLLEEGNKKKDGKYSEKAKEFISNKISKMADEDKPQDQKVAIAMSMARKKGLKVPKEKKMNESILSEEVKVDRDTLMDILKDNYPKAWFKPGEDFSSDYSENTIWSGEGSYANNGMKLFDPYSEDYKNYELEVYKPFNDFIESMGYYVESYDAGTFFILPV